MKISEVVKQPSSNLSQDTVNTRLETYNIDDFEKTNFQINGFDLYKKDNEKFVVFDNNKAISYLITYQYKNNMLEVKIAGVDKKYKRKGLMYSLYKLLVTDLNYILISDSTWTKGAEMLWKKLINDFSLKVQVFDKSTNENFDIKKRLPPNFFKNVHMRLMLSKG